MLSTIIQKITEAYSTLSDETIAAWKEDIKILELKKGTRSQFGYPLWSDQGVSGI